MENGPLQDLTRSGALAKWLEQRIIDRDMQPGDFIGTFEDLRGETGLARPTVSEAVRLLVDRGVATVRLGRGGGVFVAEQNDIVRLRRTLLNVHGSVSQISDAVSVRDALEELVALEALEHRSDEDVEDLKGFVTQLEEFSGGIGDFLELNWALHRKLAEISPNELLKATYLGTMKVIADMTSVAEEEPPADYLARRVSVHTELAQAVISGDADDVRAAVEAHASL